LIYALLIYAGIEGIEKKLELPSEMAEDAMQLPGSRKEAAKFAENSEFVRNIVPEEIIKEYTRM